MQYLALALISLLSQQVLDAGAPPGTASDRPVIAAGKAKRPSDPEIRKRMIEESIADHDGPCACPYQRARNGSLCGKRSAYNRRGGYEPLCYASDVSDEMVAAYRAAHGLE